MTEEEICEIENIIDKMRTHITVLRGIVGRERKKQ